MSCGVISISTRSCLMLVQIFNLVLCTNPILFYWEWTPVPRVAYRFMPRMISRGIAYKNMLYSHDIFISTYRTYIYRPLDFFFFFAQYNRVVSRKKYVHDHRSQWGQLWSVLLISHFILVQLDIVRHDSIFRLPRMFDARTQDK